MPTPAFSDQGRSLAAARNVLDAFAALGLTRLRDEAVFDLLHLRNPKGSVYYKVPLEQYPVEASSPLTFGEQLHVAAPTGTPNEYAFFNFGARRGTVTKHLWSVGLCYPVVSGTAVETGASWLAMNVIAGSPALAFRRAAAANHSVTISVTGSRLVVRFLKSTTAGLCRVLVDGNASNCTFLPRVQTAAEASAVGVAIGEQYYNCYDSGGTGWEDVELGEFPHGQHTITLSFLGTGTGSDKRIGYLWAGAIGGSLSTDKWAVIHPLAGDSLHSGTAGQFSAFSGVMRLTANCASSDFVGDYHGYHSGSGGHDTEAGTPTEKLFANGVEVTPTAGQVYSASDLSLELGCILQEYVAASVVSVAERQLRFGWGTSAGTAICRMLQRVRFLDAFTVGDFYAAVLPFFNPYFPPGGWRPEVYPHFIANGTRSVVPQNDTNLNAGPVDRCGVLIGDKSLSVRLLQQSGRGSAFGSPNGGYHTTCRGRSNGQGKIYFAGVGKQLSVTSGEIWVSESELSLGTNPNAELIGRL